MTQDLSITTFRYVPRDLRADVGGRAESSAISTAEPASC